MEDTALTIDDEQSTVRHPSQAFPSDGTELPGMKPEATIIGTEEVGRDACHLVGSRIDTLVLSLCGARKIIRLSYPRTRQAPWVRYSRRFETSL